MCGLGLYFYSSSWSLDHLSSSLRLLETQGESGASKVKLWSPELRVEIGAMGHVWFVSNKSCLTQPRLPFRAALIQ